MVPTPRDLVDFFQRAGKPRSAWRLGIEQEKIPVRPDGQPVPFEGRDGIGAFLARLEPQGFTAEREGGHLVGLRRGEERITLEPGAQVELSSAALPNAAACASALVDHVRETAAAAAPLGIKFVAGGYRPFGTLEDTSWLPKARYDEMRTALPRRGPRALEMMKQTATVQANVDFEDEVDAMAKLRTALGATSVVAALFAASPLREGRPSGCKSTRAAVWLETDETRCGILPFLFAPGAGFQAYADWALDAPMLFLVREARYRGMGDATFRRFLREGWQGESATIADWQTHLSTLFPEVRLRGHIEMRGADAGPLPMARALGALWRGLLDDPEARAAAWAVVGAWPLADRVRLRQDVPRAGLATEVEGRRLSEVAVDLCRIAEFGLGRLPGGQEDRLLIAPALEYALAGRCPADDMLDDYRSLGGNPARLCAAWELKA